MTVAVILAGGLGTRLRSVVADVPKPMAPVDGKPFLDYLMHFWRRQGVTRFVLSVGYQREIIQNHVGKKFQDAEVDYAIEETPLGTGGGVLLACEKLNDAEPFLLLNGDTFFDVPLDAYLAFHNARKSDWSYALFQPQEADRYLSLDIADDGLIRTLNTGKKEAGGWANGGVYLTTPSAIRRAGYKAGDKLSLENDLMPKLQDQGGALYGMKNKGKFIDIGLPRDYLKAGEILAPFFAE